MKHLPYYHFYCVRVLTLFIVFNSCTSTEPTGAQNPNILLIVADDLGYADLGCYGGDIETPNIDQLAANGIRFSRFHTSPLCAPTRAMLLTGNDNHIAGMGRQGAVTNDFGYEGHLSDRIVTIPQVLGAGGYHTYMAGKWHLGMDSSSDPHRKGFEHSFVNLHGAGNHYDDQGLFESTPISQYTEDGQPVQWPNGRYSTDLFTDKLIEYIERHREDGQPFFAFAAYTSPHWPLQVDEEYWKKYEGRYDDGYEKLKERRLESLKKAGMIPENAILPPNHRRVKPWDSLTADEKKKEARKMELYAGMVDNLDVNIGRLLQYLKDTGEFDNTIIVFMADNGAAAEDFYYDDDYGPFLQQHFNDDYKDMGKPNSFISYGPQWAEAGSAPFRYFKGQTTEGGISAPMIISGPGVKNIGTINHTFLTLKDMAPSFYELAGATYPDNFNGKKVYPLQGDSWVSLVQGSPEAVHSSDYIFAIEHSNRSFIRKGDWKLTGTELPYSLDSFELYNLANDLAEMHDLKEQEKEKFEELLAEWQTFAEAIKMQVPPPMDEDEDEDEK